jgi:capsular polysaccharide biosynthesis protein
MDYRSLNYEELKRAVVLPLHQSMTDGFVQSAGVYVDENPVYQALEHQFGGQIKFAPYQSPSTFIEQPVIYAGILYHHYGHFLVESLSRLWLTQQYPEAPILWIGESSLKPWQIEIMSLLKIHNPHLFISEPTQVETLRLPELGFTIEQCFERHHAEFLEAFQASVIIPGKYCWVSRRNLNSGREGLINEYHLEEKLSKLGWEIFQPEKFSLTEQLCYFSSCEKVAGVQGSALHFPMLVKNLKTHLYILDARGLFTYNFEIVAKEKKLTQKMISLPANSRKFPTNDPYFFNFLCPNFTSILNDLEILGNPSKAPFEDSSFLSRTLNHLNQGNRIEQYLELGIDNGQHFFNVEAYHKVGVSPDAHLDFRSMLTDEIEIFETNVHDYFVHFYDHAKFDVICINSEKHLDSIFKEFSATLSCSHPNTIWLINGSMPRDLYDTLPSHTELFNIRKKMTGVEDWSWNGQVYQLILALHDFFPMMNYFTMSEGNNHQTIVWFEPRQQFKPRFNSFETIAKATYTDYLAHQDLYNMIPLEEAYAKLTELAQRAIRKEQLEMKS